jgi:ketosteroid isomerase-like protein
MNVLRLRAIAPMLALAAFTIGASPAGPMMPVRQFVDAFNKGDAKAMLETCASATGIIDDFPPHAWMSCSDWYDAFVAFSKRDGDTGATVVLGTPTHVDVTGNVAYVVVPTTYTFKHRGKPVKQAGSTWTLVVKNTPAGWRITAWAWADGK